MKEQLNIRVDNELKEALRKIAKDNRRSMAQQIEYMIQKEKEKA